MIAALYVLAYVLIGVVAWRATGRDPDHLAPCVLWPLALFVLVPVCVWFALDWLLFDSWKWLRDRRRR